MIGFGSLVAMGVANRRRPEWHKRLMISATMLITSQALGRLLPISSFGDAAPGVLFGVVTLLALVFESTSGIEKRRLLNFVLSNCIWQTASFAQITGNNLIWLHKQSIKHSQMERVQGPILP